MLGSVPGQAKVVLHQQGQLSFSHRKKVMYITQIEHPTFNVF
jgi:hypothetical protein